MNVHEYTIDAWDGTELFCEVYGRPLGTAPAAYLNDGIGCDGFAWKYLGPALAERYTVVHPHYRGHGRSGKAPSLQHYRIEDLVRDIDTVMDALRLEDAVMFGHSMGVQVTLEATLTLTDRVRAAGLVCGSFGRPLDTFHDHAWLKQVVPRVLPLVQRWSRLIQPVLERVMPSELGWLIAQATEVDGRMLRREDFIPYLEHLAQMDQVVFLHMLLEASQHSTETRLDQVDCPVLVLGGEKDKFTPFWVSEVMAQRLPACELRMIRGGTHTAPLEHVALTELLVEDWLRRNDLLPDDFDRAPGLAVVNG